MKNVLLFLVVGCGSLFSQQLRFVRSIGGADPEHAQNLVVSPKHSVYAVGYHLSGTMTLQGGCGVVVDPIQPSESPMLILKYDTAGACAWSRQLKSPPGSTCNAVLAMPAADASDNLFVFGAFTGTLDLDPGPATAVVATNPDLYDFFVARYDASGNHLWSFSLAADQVTASSNICAAVDKNGNLVIASKFLSKTIDFDPGPGTTALTASSTDNFGFVAKYNSAGTLAWAYNMGVAIHDLSVILPNPCTKGSFS